MNNKRLLNSILIIFSGILIISFGVFMFVFGELDDSPGGQLLGLVVVIFGVVGIIKGKKKNFKSN